MEPRTDAMQRTVAFRTRLLGATLVAERALLSGFARRRRRRRRFGHGREAFGLFGVGKFTTGLKEESLTLCLFLTLLGDAGVRGVGDDVADSSASQHQVLGEQRRTVYQMLTGASEIFARFEVSQV